MKPWIAFGAAIGVQAVLLGTLATPAVSLRVSGEKVQLPVQVMIEEVDYTADQPYVQIPGAGLEDFVDASVPVYIPVEQGADGVASVGRATATKPDGLFIECGYVFTVLEIQPVFDDDPENVIGASCSDLELPGSLAQARGWATQDDVVAEVRIGDDGEAMIAGIDS